MINIVAYVSLSFSIIFFIGIVVILVNYFLHPRDDDFSGSIIRTVFACITLFLLASDCFRIYNVRDDVLKLTEQDFSVQNYMDKNILDITRYGAFYSPFDQNIKSRMDIINKAYKEYHPKIEAKAPSKKFCFLFRLGFNECE